MGRIWLDIPPTGAERRKVEQRQQRTGVVRERFNELGRARTL